MNEDKSFEEAENEMNKGAIWGVVYGDFMSNMMVFFLVLFSFSLKSQMNPQSPTLDESLSGIQKEFGGKISQKVLDRLTQRKIEDDVSKKLQKMIDTQGIADQAKVEISAAKVKLVLTAPILFDPGRAELKAEAMPIITGVVKTLAELNKEIMVEGHTDNTPIAEVRFAEKSMPGFDGRTIKVKTSKGVRYESNWDLSAARANAVVRLLIRQGMPPQRLTATGYGEYRPVAPNDTSEHRAQNRRIEISVIR